MKCEVQNGVAPSKARNSAVVFTGLCLVHAPARPNNKPADKKSSVTSARASSRMKKCSIILSIVVVAREPRIHRPIQFVRFDVSITLFLLLSLLLLLLLLSARAFSALGFCISYILCAELRAVYYNSGDKRNCDCRLTRFCMRDEIITEGNSSRFASRIDYAAIRIGAKKSANFCN